MKNVTGMIMWTSRNIGILFKGNTKFWEILKIRLDSDSLQFWNIWMPLEDVL